MTEIQKIILTCLLGPEDKKAWRRWKAVQRVRDWREKVYTEDSPRPYGEKEQKAAANRYQKNRDTRIKYSAGYREEFPEKSRESHRKTNLKRRKTVPEFRLSSNLRSRVRGALKRAIAKKGATTFHLVGCSSKDLMGHLESLFKPGMTWENYGPVWHVDHKRPCGSFNLLEVEQQKACFHWTNLQPLFAAENIAKGDKYAG